MLVFVAAFSEYFRIKLRTCYNLAQRICSDNRGGEIRSESCNTWQASHLEATQFLFEKRNQNDLLRGGRCPFHEQINCLFLADSELIREYAKIKAILHGS
jgi:hypothetical protein